MIMAGKGSFLIEPAREKSRDLPGLLHTLFAIRREEKRRTGKVIANVVN
jgi:hypothetical protein